MGHYFFAARGDGHEGASHNVSSGAAERCWGKNMGLGHLGYLERFPPEAFREIEQLVYAANKQYLRPRNASDPEPWLNQTMYVKTPP